MKVKELYVTANLAWSPHSQSPVYLATGTAAQQLDATFSTSSTLEIHRLNLGESGYDMPKAASMAVEHRYHKLVWGEASGGAGVIVGGLDQGLLNMYDAEKILEGKDGALIASKNKHTGPVQAIDFNPFQKNLLASGKRKRLSVGQFVLWRLSLGLKFP
jgi:protein transport protein SEC31